MKKVSKKTIDRALLYMRILEGLIKEKRNLISSGQLADIAQTSDVQIRKDISHFGKVGTPRLGYNTKELKKILEDFILQENVVRVVLFGVGNLGTAIIKYPGFHKGKVKMIAAFEKDAQKIGKKINNLTIYPIERAPEVIRKTKAHIGIIAVPKEYAQEVADLIVLSGLRSIINFAPESITVPKNVLVKDIDLTIEFLSLFCNTQRVKNDS
ncbi:MAG: redox-sensing transcriptional repressor Rex [Candidatus Omnitrophota bacterium]